MTRIVRSVRVPDGDAPSPEVIAARIDLGSADYHDMCCGYALWCADESMFDGPQSCDCGGNEMAKVYASLAALTGAERERFGVPIGPLCDEDTA